MSCEEKSEEFTSLGLELIENSRCLNTAVSRLYYGIILLEASILNLDDKKRIDHAKLFSLIFDLQLKTDDSNRMELAIMYRKHDYLHSMRNKADYKKMNISPDEAFEAKQKCIELKSFLSKI